MALVNPDFSDAVERIEPGVPYVATIESYEQRTSQAGNPCINWELNVQGLRVFHNTNISGRGAGLLKQLLTKVIPGYTEGPFDPDKCVGKVIKVTLKRKPDSKYLEVADIEAATDEDVPF